MAIQMRRGALSRFDSSRLVAGEIAVATDDNMIGVAKSPTEFLELATQEDLASVYGGTVEVEGQCLVFYSGDET